MLNHSKKPTVIKELCSWVQPWLVGRKGCSQEHISLTTNSFVKDFAFIIQIIIEHSGSWNVHTVRILKLLVSRDGSRTVVVVSCGKTTFKGAIMT